MNHDAYDDAYLEAILRDTRTIAVLGASPNELRPSNYVAHYLIERGYTVYPVNPGHAGKPIRGRLTYASLADVPEAIDMVDVFRPSRDLPAIAAEVLALPRRPRVVWTQLTVRDDAAAARLEAAGIEVVQDRCPKIEYPRLIGHAG